MIDLSSIALLRATEVDPRERAILEYLRSMVLSSKDRLERFHAVFLDEKQGFVGDAPLGQGRLGSLSFRMRELFTHALAFDASGMVIAHNHPSGSCRPSQFDIDSTCRLNTLAKGLDIKLLDHLIFTHDAVYSMRAGGKL
ncbi:MAG: JAB domain-containing protein [Erythrobacter sp.]